MGEVSGSFSFEGGQNFSDLVRVSKEIASIDRDHIRERERSDVGSKLDPPPSDARPEQLEEIKEIYSDRKHGRGKAGIGAAHHAD